MCFRSYQLCCYKLCRLHRAIVALHFGLGFIAFLLLRLPPYPHPAMDEPSNIAFCRCGDAMRFSPRHPRNHCCRDCRRVDGKGEDCGPGFADVQHTAGCYDRRPHWIPSIIVDPEHPPPIRRLSKREVEELKQHVAGSAPVPAPVPAPGVAGSSRGTSSAAAEPALLQPAEKARPGKKRKKSVDPVLFMGDICGDDMVNPAKARFGYIISFASVCRHPYNTTAGWDDIT